MLNLVADIGYDVYKSKKRKRPFEVVIKQQTKELQKKGIPDGQIEVIINQIKKLKEQDDKNKKQVNKKTKKIKIKKMKAVRLKSNSLASQVKAKSKKSTKSQIKKEKEETEEAGRYKGNF